MSKVTKVKSRKFVPQNPGKLSKGELSRIYDLALRDGSGSRAHTAAVLARQSAERASGNKALVKAYRRALIWGRLPTQAELAPAS